MKTTKNNKDVLISGAGVAGPALAFWLNIYGFRTTIVEKAPAIRTGGYRVDIRGVATDIVRRMGLLKEVHDKGTAMQGSSMVNNDGKRIINLDDPDIFGMRQAGDMEIMRGDLSAILYNATKDNTQYIFDDSITSIIQTTEQVTVKFKMMEEQSFDLVVAADGLHSNVRKLAFNKENVFIKNLGYYVGIFTMPNYFKLDHWELAFPAPGKVINVYSTHSTAEAKAFLMFASENIVYNYHNIDEQKAIIANGFKDTGWELPGMLKAMYDAHDFYFDSISQVHINTLANQRVVLLGDAGYCASPASGQGTSLALTGAYVLAGELATAIDHCQAFVNYEREMKGFINLNQQLGISVLKEMVPKSKMQVWFQNMAMRVMLHLPDKEKVFKSMVKKTQDAVNRAANGIQLKSYQ